MTFPRLLSPLAFLLAGLSGLVATRAAEVLSPLDLVGADAAIVVELRDAGEHVRTVRGSTWFDRLRATDLFRRWQASPQHARLNEAREKLGEAFGRPAGDVLDDLFGREAVLAIYAQEDGPAAGVLITRAASDAALDSILEVWNRIEPADRTRRDYGGREYVHRARPRGNDPGVYFVRIGPLIALSDREAMIRRAIDLANETTTDGAGRVAGLDEFRACGAALPAGGMARVFIQPQRLRKPREEAAALDPAARLVASWGECRSIGATARFERGWRLDAVARFPESSASPEWQRFVERSAGGPRLAGELPAQALAAWTGRLDLSQVAEIWEKAAPEKTRRDLAKPLRIGRGLLLGRDLLTDVLPRLGPDMAGAIFPAAAADPHPPISAALLTTLAEPGDAEGAPLAAALDNALNTGLNLLAGAHNSDDASTTVATVRTMGDAETKTRWLEGLEGVEPAYAVGDGRLIVATAAEAIASVRRPGSRLSELAAFRAAAERFVPDAGHLLFVNAAGLRELHDRDRPRLARHAARRHGLSPEEAEARLSELRDVLTLADALYLSLRVGQAELRLSAGGTLAGTPER